MGKRWATVATTTYADNSPADDGSAVAANKVSFATIKTDLTDPLDTAIDSIVSNLDGLFADEAVAHSSAHTTTATDHAKVLEVSGTTTITLIAAATGGAGYRVGVKNAGSAVVTVDGNGAETIDGAANVTVHVGGTSWFLVNAAGTGWIELKAANVSEATGFHAVPASGQATVVSGSPTDIIFGTETYDLGGDFATPNFVAPFAGEYLLTAGVTANTMTAGKVLICRLYNVTTAAVIAIGSWASAETLATTPSASVSAVVRLAAGDNVRAQVVINEAVGLSAAAGETWFSGSRLS